MTDKCKLPTCENKLVHTEGRRPKEFCSPKCRTLFHNLKKVKGVGRGRPKGSKNKIIKKEGVEYINNMTYTNDSYKATESNKFLNAARGRDESGVNEDEFKGYGKLSKKEKEFVRTIKKTINTPEIKKAMKESFNELSTFGTATVKTELIDGEVKAEVVNKKQIVNEKPQMPTGLTTAEKIQWKIDNL